MFGIKPPAGATVAAPALDTAPTEAGADGPTSPERSAPAIFDTTDPAATTAARGSSHGSFYDNGRISQQLKDYFRAQAGYQRLTFVQAEALDNIAIKISRILSGNPAHPAYVDNFDDIAGYAHLAAKELRGEAM